MKFSSFARVSAFLAFALLFCSAVVSPSFAGGGKKNATPPAPPDKRILIKSVDAKASTIEIETMKDKRSYTYGIDEITKVVVNNSPSTIAKIEVGMEVTDYVERDAHTLDSVTVGMASPAPVAPAKTPATPKKKTSQSSSQ